tara:strand:- start:182 stop:931 length:750 start_codon:yes stop_codon:yes gene_type:complete
MIDIKKFKKDGYLILKSAIPKRFIHLFKKDINSVKRVLQKQMGVKNKEFEYIFGKNKFRPRIYNLLQNLSSVRDITKYVEKYLIKHNFFKNLSFNTRSITNGLIISLPNETKNLNPLHQDIYNYYSSKFVKLWIPMTKVDRFHGTMQMFKGSHKLGFVRPKYENKKSTYPKINKNILKNFEDEVLDLKPNSLVIFNPLIIHKGITNISSIVRFNIGIDIQDISFKENDDLIIKMKKIKDQRSKRRKLFS